MGGRIVRGSDGIRSGRDDPAILYYHRCERTAQAVTNIFRRSPNRFLHEGIAHLRSLDRNSAAGIVPEKVTPGVCGFVIRGIG
jgi:hypothetical protein